MAVLIKGRRRGSVVQYYQVTPPPCFCFVFIFVFFFPWSTRRLLMETQFREMAGMGLMGTLWIESFKVLKWRQAGLLRKGPHSYAMGVIHVVG